MVWSFIIFVISLILRLGVDRLALKYDFMSTWGKPFDYVVLGTLLLFVVFALIAIIKAIFKK